ncbi:unnamed protein product [Rotaria sp. Silwood2]|nr:unnamed protein product [Rotaria sp. Silwood2]
MASSSINIINNISNSLEPVPMPAQKSMDMIGFPVSSNTNALSSNDSFDDFETVKNKKKLKRKHKMMTSSRLQSNFVPTSVLPVPITSSSNITAAATTNANCLISNGDQHNDAAKRLSLPQQISITTESTRYAQTRYPFPPFIIKFIAGNVLPKQVKEELLIHCKNVFQTEINILNCRLSNISSNNDYDILLFVKDSYSYSFLLDQKHWPNVFNNVNYAFPSDQVIPPQLSLIVKNVDLHLDFDDFCSEIKLRYPSVKNVIRMKNKFQSYIKLVKLELTSSSLREELLNGKKIIIGYIAYDIAEYLAPATVLICSKCMGLGHFKKQCSQIKNTCRTCGDLVDDLKLHICSKIEKCIHCGLDHKSNSLKCHMVKSYRSELTRKLLSSNNHSSHVSQNGMIDLNKNVNIVYNNSHFPGLPVAQNSSSNHMLNKLDNLLAQIAEVNVHLSNLKVKNDKIEQITLAKNDSDILIKENLNLLAKQSMELKKSFITIQNCDSNGRTLDADLKLKLERYLIQMKKAKEAKASLSPFEFYLFCEILEEWETYPNLQSCFSSWQNFVQVSGKSKPKLLSYNILSFNVRGLDLRWQEVLLLISSFNFDILVLIETGIIDTLFYEKIFSNFKIFYQKGENKHGEILVLVRVGIISSRIRCDLPNVCVVDIKGEEDFRLLGVYAPNSKSWSWDDLSLFLSKKCIVYGDFNVDIMQDGQKAESLLEWTDNHFLAPVIPSSATSLRSNRVIDYALICGLNIDIQTYNGNTTSDHRPVISTIPFKVARQKLENWNISSLDSTYNDYIRFLFLLSTRCTTFFSLDKYRSALPVELRSFLSYIRALSFRQIRTKCSIVKKEVLFLKKIAKNELNRFFSSKLDYLLHVRNSSSPAAISFWHKSKRCLIPSSSSIHALVNTSGEIIRENEQMCELAADYYESFFKSSNIIRPHPYTDSPPVMFDNMDDVIPEVTLDELMSSIHAKRKKKSLDAHGIANFMFNFLHFNHWSLLYSHNFISKKEHVCPPSLTRPISLLDSFQKVGEKLFLTRFRNVLLRRGLLPDNQSGFRENFRLQTRLLLFLEDLRSLMSNSSPICTIFVDFRTAFDQLWFAGCIGKLHRLGIPPAYLNWIYAWLLDRRGFIEINETRSRWFNIDKGCPQGSVLSPTLFITYNCDLGSSLAGCISHLFADDMAGIVAGQLGIKYTYQCLDLEKRLKVFIDHLEYYSCLTDQPINTNKTQALFTTRAIGHPKFDIHFNSGSKEKINWVSEFKYLGYLISPKLSWDAIICRNGVPS